jgi:hypothetical protein
LSPSLKKSLREWKEQIVLQAIPKAWYSLGFTVLDGAQTIADIDRSWWFGRGVLTVQGATYKIYREGLIYAALILESEETVLARAVMKPGLLSGSSFSIEHAGKQYSLHSSGNKSTLLDGLGEKIGALAKDRDPELGAKVDLPDELPLVVKVFIFSLALILWKSESESE